MVTKSKAKKPSTPTERKKKSPAVTTTRKGSRKPKKPPRTPAAADKHIWQFARLHSGQPPAYTPAALWDKACEYFAWCEANPWYRHDVVKVAGKNFGKQVKTSVGRPYTVSGFCIFAGISEQTFMNYTQGIGYAEYFGYCDQIRQIIRNQKFEGASIGAFNANLIARDLGITEKVDTNLANKDDKPLQVAGTLEVKPGMDSKTATAIYSQLIHPVTNQT